MLATESTSTIVTDTLDLDLKSAPKSGMAVLLVGPAGSGKSAHGKLIQNHFNGAVYISTGDLMRERGDQNQINEGQFSPDDIVASCLVDKLKYVYTTINTAINTEQPMVIFDGYPRNVNQVLTFLNLVEQNFSSLYIIKFRCNKNLRIQRQQKRQDRQDTDITAIKTRSQLYRSQTIPAIQYLIDLLEFREIFWDRYEINTSQEKSTVSNFILDRISQRLKLVDMVNRGLM